MGAHKLTVSQWSHQHQSYGICLFLTLKSTQHVLICSLCINTLSAALDIAGLCSCRQPAPFSCKTTMTWHKMHRFTISAKCSPRVQPQRSFRCTSEHIYLPTWSRFITRYQETSDSWKQPCEQTSLNSSSTYSLNIWQDIFKVAHWTVFIDNHQTSIWTASKDSLLSNVLHHSPQPITLGVCRQPLLHLNFLSAMRSFWKPFTSLLKFSQHCN